MAESDPIKLEDFADPSAVPQYQGQWQSVVDTLTKAEELLTRLASLTGKTVNNQNIPKTKKEYDDLNDTLKKLEDTQMKLTAIERAKIEAQVKSNAEIAAYRQQVKETIAVQGAATDSITAMRVQLRLLNDEYNKGDAAIRAKLVPTINTLKDKLNTTQHAIGNFQNQVGNYAIGLGKYGKAIMPITHVIKGLGEAFGFHIEGLREFALTLRGANHLTEMAIEGEEKHTAAVMVDTEAQVANTEATEGQTVAIEGMSAAEAGVGSGALGIAAALAVAGVALYEYFEDTKLAKQMSKDFSEQLKSLHDAIEKAQDAQDKLNLSTRDYSSLQIQKKYIKDADEAWSKYKDTMIDLGGVLTSQGWDNSGVIDEKAAQKAQNIYNATISKLQTTLKADIGKVDKDSNKKDLKSQDEYLKEIELLNDEFIENKFKKEKAKNETERKFAILEEEQSEHTEEQKRKTISEINTIYDLKDDAARLAYGHERDKKRAEYHKKQIDDKRKSAIEQERLNKEGLDKRLKQEEDFNKLKKKITEQGLEISINKDEANTRKDELANAKPEQITADNIKTQGDKYAKTQADTNKKYSDELEQAGDNAQAISDLEKQWAVQSEIDAENNENALTKIKQEGEKKRLDIIKKNEEAILESAKKGIEEQSKLQQEGLKTDEQMLASNAQVQATLAAAGKRNSLDAVEAEETKNAQAQKDIQRKEREAEEALDLAGTFEKAVNSNLDKGMSNEQAIEKALATTFLAKGIADGFMAAAGFATGVENLQGPGTGTSDSIPIWASKGESIITAEGTSQYPGLATAVNKGQVNDWFKSVYMPKFLAQNGGNDSAITEMMVDKIVGGFKKAINEQPREIAYQVGNKTVVKESRNGYNHTTIIEAPEWGTKSRS